MQKRIAQNFVVRGGELRLVLLLFVDFSAPIKGSRNLFASGIHGYLFIEEARCLSILTDPIVQPCRSPMAAGSITVSRKALCKFAVIDDCLGQVFAEEVHVSAGIKRLCQPLALRETRFHLLDELLLIRSVVLAS